MQQNGSLGVSKHDNPSGNENDDAVRKMVEPTQHKHNKQQHQNNFTHAP